VISKSDLLDEELKQEIQATLPETVTTLFISAIANTGLTPLKDTIWQKLQQ
jgi:GTP-binding protein